MPRWATGYARVRNSGPRARIVQTLPTQISARTITIDPRTGRLYLPAATLNPPAAAGGRMQAVPGSFVVLVIGPASK